MAGLQSKQVHGSGTYSFWLWTFPYNSYQLYQTSRRNLFWFLMHSMLLLPGHNHFTDVPLKSSRFPLSRCLPRACCPLPHLAGDGWATEEKTNKEILNPTSHHHLLPNRAVCPKAGTTRELPANTRFQGEICLQEVRLINRIWVFLELC